MAKIKKWQLLSEKDISPSPWFPLYVHQVKLPDGKVIDEYYVSKLGDVAMVVAITKKKEIVFVRQYKHGIGEIVLELPAGRIGKRTPEKAAKEELREETGIVAEELVYLGGVVVAPSKDSTVTHGFLVKNAKATKKQRLDEHENIEIILIPLSQIETKIKNGEIKVADTIAILNLFRLKAPDLFK